jgi:aryl-alcohol dehydrogenase-like predicted oxidoreductase
MQSSPIRTQSVRLGNSDLEVYRIGLGAWPMAGITSLGVTDEASVETIHRALDFGVNHIDTAYAYGIGGRSDRVIAEALAGRPERVVLASKVGARLDDQGVWMNDARPESIIQQAREIRDRLRVDMVDLMYLHAPDPKVPLSESADALKNVVDRGWVRWAGVSNVDFPQLELFHDRCPVVAVQTYFNMFQQDSVLALRDYCQSQSISLVVYWVLMKGLLAGAMARDHILDPSDRRRKYPVYQGEQWQSAQDLLDQLRSMARDKQCSVSQLVIAWTLLQPGIAVALVGAKRPEQIEETAVALQIPLTAEELREMDGWIAEFQLRGDWAR